MRFWDSSGIVPLLVTEVSSDALLALLLGDDAMTVWWGSRLECVSALVRRSRESGGDSDGVRAGRTNLDQLAASWSEVEPTGVARSLSERLVSVHFLRAADALQLAAALIWSDESPNDRAFVCLDNRLREAARREGFRVEPDTLGT